MSNSGYEYYLGKHFARCGVAIRFDHDTTTLMCQLERSEETIGLPAEAHHKSRTDGGAGAPASLADLSISSPFLLGGLATTGVRSQLDRYDFVRLDKLIMRS